jgi:hypothetical protein
MLEVLYLDILKADRILHVDVREKRERTRGVPARTLGTRTPSEHAENGVQRGCPRSRPAPSTIV